MAASFIWLYPFKLNCSLGRYQQMTCKAILRMLVATSFQKLFCSVLSSNTFNIQLVVLKEWKQETKNYGSIHQYMFLSCCCIPKIVIAALRSQCISYHRQTANWIPFRAPVFTISHFVRFQYTFSAFTIQKSWKIPVKKMATMVKHVFHFNRK